MQSDRIPLVVLGGSDRTAAVMPSGGGDQHPLTGYKGADIRIDGRSLVELVLDGVLASGCFAPVWVAGPRRAYNGLRGPAELIDTDGSFGDNIRASLESVRRLCPGSPVAFLTCDVLPKPEALQRLIADYIAHVPCDLWFAVVRTPPDRQLLGASSWKPVYRVVPAAGEPAVEILPGHLVVVDPQALRRTFLYDLFQIAYSTRNRPIAHRRNVMLRKLVVQLLLHDLRHLLALRLPTLTWTVVVNGVRAAAALRKGTITIVQLEDALRALLITRHHRRQYPDRRVSVRITDELSLALDIDTEEEARELACPER